jgi:hypothetical protein
MGLADRWLWLFDKDSGGLAAALVLAGLAASLALILKYWSEFQKNRADRQKLGDERARAVADKLGVAHQRIVTCAEAVHESSSTMVKELNNAFYPFAYPPEYVGRVTLQEWIESARRYRHEQAYRNALEKLIAELSERARNQPSAAIERLLRDATELLEKVSEKKRHVVNVEERGLSHDVVQSVRSWLDDVRERQMRLGPLVGIIRGRSGPEHHEPAE